MSSLSETIRTVPDFPKPGIMFRDITTLLKDPDALRRTADALAEHFRNARIQKVAGIESRGFIFGATLAVQLGAGFVPLRKKGKLPAKTLKQEYALEYGTDSIEMHEDAIEPGERVLLHDDLLATGGTMGAACRLIESVKGEIVGLSFLIELSFLHGREQLRPYEVHSLIQYDSE